MKTLSITDFGSGYSFIELDINKYLIEPLDNDFFKFNLSDSISDNIFIDILDFIRNYNMYIKYNDKIFDLSYSTYTQELKIKYIKNDHIIFEILSKFDFKKFRKDIYNDYIRHLNTIFKLTNNDRYKNKIISSLDYLLHNLE